MACRLPSASHHESLVFGFANTGYQRALQLGEVSFGRVEIKFHRKTDERFMISHAPADLVSRLRPPALLVFSCDF